MKKHIISAIVSFTFFIFFNIGFYLWIFKTSCWAEILAFEIMRLIPGIITVVTVILAINKQKSNTIEQERQYFNSEVRQFEAEKKSLSFQNALAAKEKSEFEQEKQQLVDKQKYVEKKINELEKLTEFNEKKTLQFKEVENNHKEEIARLNKKIASLNEQIKAAESELLVSETTVFDECEGITSEETKDKLTILRVEYKDFIKSGAAVIQTNPDAYSKKSRLNDNIKQILRCFNSEASNIIANVSATNVEKQRAALTKSFETINSIFASDGLKLNAQLLEYRLKELNLLYTYQEKKAQEQEEQKAIRAQMLEEEKVRREIEREKAKVEKEETQFKNEVDKLMKYLSKTEDDIQKQLYVDKIKELEEKIKLLEKDKENILQREQNTRAGFVYIISNIGSFGEDIYKIGMTRRLEPMDRIDELGSASVPFPFDVHAMIFSDDAPSLETTLHNTFRDNQVNLVNPRKEFYNVSLSEIEKVVKENYNATVTFTQVAQAAQYRESVRLRAIENS